MNNLNQLLTDFRKAVAGMEKVQGNALRFMGIIAVKNIKENFRWQGYNSGDSFTSWQQRAAKTQVAYSQGRGKGGKSRYKGSVYNAANPLLQQTRTLLNSIHFEVTGRKVFVGANLDLAPYAEAHNTGSPSRGLPKRQYMPYDGPNVGMIKEFVAKINAETAIVMAKFK